MTPNFLRRLAFLAATVASTTALADTSFVPTWIRTDAATGAVRLDVAAEWNPNNDWGNFNGYQRGDATVLIPAGAEVTIDFHLIGDHWPHSLMLTAPFDPAHLPTHLGKSDAIEGVASRKPIDGLEPGQNDALHFTAKPGTYWLVSAKGADLVSGMWIVVEVRDSLKRAELLVGRRIGSDLEGRR
jgi:hypothetical protein